MAIILGILVFRIFLLWFVVNMARKRNRDALLWGIFALLEPVVTMIFLCFLPKIAFRQESIFITQARYCYWVLRDYIKHLFGGH